MKALMFNKPFEVDVVEINRPAPKFGEVLLKIKYVGFCGSDLNSYLGRNPMVSYPRIPGHEIAAEIVQIAEGVPNNFYLGQLVTVIPYSNCGTCSSCKSYRFNACQYNETLGVQRDGAMSEFIVMSWKKLVVAEGLNEQELAVVEPLTVGFHSVERGRVAEGDTVLVFGCGMIGIGAIIGAVQRGAKVLAVDIDDAKLALAKSIGAHEAINTSKDDLQSALKDTAPNGVNVVIEAVGNAKTYIAALEVVAFCGRVVCIGYAKEDIALATKLIVQKELDMLGSRNATVADFSEVVKFLQKNTFSVDALISNVVDLNSATSYLPSWSKNPNEVTKLLLKFS